MTESDLVLGLVHRFSDLEAAVAEVASLESSFSSELRNLQELARAARRTSDRDQFMSVVPSANLFAERLRTAARKARTTSAKLAFEKMLQQGSLPDDAFGDEVRTVVRTIRTAASPEVRNYLEAKSALVRGIARTFPRLPVDKPLITHALLNLSFGRLVARWRGTASVLVDGTTRGSTNVQIVLTVATYNVSLDTSAPYTPASQQANIQPMWVTTLFFT